LTKAKFRKIKSPDEKLNFGKKKITKYKINKIT